MKISMDEIRRIIKEELEADMKPAEKDKKTNLKDKGSQQKDPKITNSIAATAAKASEKNAQVQKGAEKAAEKGGSTLTDSLLADLLKFTKKGVSKEKLTKSLKIAMSKIPNE